MIAEKILKRLPAKMQANILSNLLLIRANLEAGALPEPEPFALIQDDIKQIKLSVFIKCVVDKDYSGLVMVGEPNAEQLSEAWGKVQSDYYAINDDGAMKEYIEITSKIQQAEIHLANVANLLLVLQQFPDSEGIKEVLRGYEPYRGLTFSKETLADDIEAIKGMEIEWQIYLERYRNEYAKKYGNKESVEITEELYLNNLAELRKFESYPQPPVKLSEEMSVYDYCVALKRLREHNELLKQQQEKQKHGLSR